MSDELAHKAGEFLRTARREAKITQRMLGVKIGVGQHGSSKYEKGAVFPPIPKLHAILEAVGKDWHDFAEAMEPRTAAWAKSGVP